MDISTHVTDVCECVCVCVCVRMCACAGLRAGLAASIAGSSIISKMLLANIDPFGATPFIDPDLDSL